MVILANQGLWAVVIYHTGDLVINVIGDVGPQYCCGRVGRNAQSPFTPYFIPQSLKHNRSTSNARFQPFSHLSTQSLRTDGQNFSYIYVIAFPQLKTLLADG